MSVGNFPFVIAALLVAFGLYALLFKRNLEKVCRNRDELIDQIQITVRHEVGHHLGLSEEDMERLGLA